MSVLSKTRNLHEIRREIAAAAALPLKRATTLPRETYFDEAYFQAEADHVLRADWIAVAHVSQLDGKGGYVALDVLDEPLLAIRGDDGAVRVLSRVCPHRAMDVLPEGFNYPRAGRLNHLVCPYHRWSFASDGSLKGCPEMQEAEGFDKADWRLSQIRSEIWEGFVFVNLDGKAKPLAEQYADLTRLVGHWRCADMVVAIELQWECNFNWKVMIENWIESYHHLGIHHATLNQLMPAAGTWTEPEHPHFVHCHLPYNSDLTARLKGGERIEAVDGFRPIEGLSPEEATEWGLYVGFPCFMFLTMRDRVIWYRLQPISAERCILLTTTLIERANLDAPDYAERIAAETKMLTDFHLEDMEVNAAVQRGLRSGRAVRGRLSHLEMPVWLVQRYLAARFEGRYPGEAVPAPLKPAPLTPAPLAEAKAEPIDGAIVPRFAGIPTFMRLPVAESAVGLDVALIGVPFDGGTTNRPGARHGPREIRNQSSLMRQIHHATGVAPYTLARVADLGDVPVNPIDLMASLDRIAEFYACVKEAGAVPITAGGDHLITLPILRGLAKDRPVGLIHFDAHSDTNDSYFGGKRYTHGTPFRRAVEEGLVDPARAIQIGIRGSIYHPTDLDFARDSGFRIVFMEEFALRTPEDVMAEARAIVGEGPVYVSFDVDSLDPSIAPGTGTPEIGGLTTFEAQRMLRRLSGLDIVGADVVEVAPPFDPSGMTAIVGATIMFELLCVVAERVGLERLARAR